MNIFTDPPDSDPLRLRELPQMKPEAGRVDQDWAMVSAALQAGKGRPRDAWLTGLAAAASVALVVALVALTGREPAGVADGPQMVPQTASQPSGTSAVETSAPGGGTAAPATQPSTDRLMAMSQDMEQQLRFLREQVSSMSSETVIYQVELQDLIGQVDDALSLAPGSQELWGQRLGLQMDLAKLYRHQLRRDHLDLASL